MILVIDNYDSFTYNLVQYLGRCNVPIEVFRNDAISLEAISELRPKGILLSPGPCTPKESGVCLDILRASLTGMPGFDVPIWGVCLGHEAMGQVAGGEIRQARTIKHGKVSPIKHDGKGLFEGFPNPFSAVRYHSLVVGDAQVPEGFIVSATSADDNEIMGLRHKTLNWEGVQFHPESIATEDGFRMVENFVRKVYPS